MAKVDAMGKEYTMDPGDDYYTAPFAVVSGWTRKRNGIPKQKRTYICFTSYKCRSAHDNALHAMGDFAEGISAFGSFEDVVARGYLCKPTQVVKFRKFAWAGGDDISLDLEDRAVKLTCEFLSQSIPSDWRSQREDIVKEHAVWPLFKLPQAAQISPTEGVKPQVHLTKCACGNFAKPNCYLCNACTMGSKLTRLDRKARHP